MGAVQPGREGNVKGPSTRGAALCGCFIACENWVFSLHVTPGKVPSDGLVTGSAEGVGFTPSNYVEQVQSRHHLGRMAMGSQVGTVLYLKDQK